LFDNRAVHARVETGDLSGVRAGSRLGESNLTSLFDGFDPLLSTVFTACRVGGGGTGIFESQMLVALGGC